MEERLNWMIDKDNLSPQKMDEIIEKKRNMEFYLQYFDYKIILYEIPEGMPRPRFRFIGKNNYMRAAAAMRFFKCSCRAKAALTLTMYP